MKKNKIKWIGSIIFLLLMMFTVTKKVSAETLFKGAEIVKSGSIVVDSGEEKGLLRINNYDGNSVYLAYCEVSLYYSYYNEYCKKPIKLSARTISGYDDSADIISYSLGKNEAGYIFFGDEYYDSNKLEIVVDNADYSKIYKIKYRIEKYNGISTNLVIPSTYKMKIGDVKQLNFKSRSPYKSFPYVEWKSSNPKVATIDSTCYIVAKNKGKTVLTGTLENGRKIRCTVMVSTPAPYINYYAYTLNKGQTGNLKIMYNNKKVKWSSSNKKIATVSSSGKIKAIAVGKCVITAKVGSKKYTCKVSVVYQNPNFGAALTKYDTRENCFIVKVRNWGNKPVYISPSNAKAIDVDYKSYDRTLRLSGGKTIKINPKKLVTLRFYVNGRVTWYDYTDFTIFYRFIYDGKQYEGHTWSSDSVYKKGSKWYKTYWTTYEEKYEDWSWTY
ncbi:Ig-like domain-containing protein [Blautia sp. MSK17_66]|uniref:Ig-like domain-containing protein n=2 Tax=Lachnospiraceae TaxID=186803 RepID=UPI0015D2DAC5|nr:MULTISPECIES: Ig-like domain-containing protein [Blautia]MCB5548607.1 Ig-like domain-containing protein [Blautia sp. MSK17_66]NSK00079.1 hypothetical protein [Blautia obeum]